MKKIIIIDNFDSFTYNLVDYFRRQGVEISVFRNTARVDDIDQERADMLVYSPGPGVPAEAGNLLSYIERFSSKVPQFGVCLGMQAIVEVFGGTLGNLEHPVHGKASPVHHDGKTIFEGLPSPFEAGRYHSWVADSVPEQFKVSATLADQQTVMAIRNSKEKIEGVQFHPESILTMGGNVGEKIIENVCKQYLS